MNLFKNLNTVPHIPSGSSPERSLITNFEVTKNSDGLYTVVIKYHDEILEIPFIQVSIVNLFCEADTLRYSDPEELVQFLKKFLSGELYPDNNYVVDQRTIQKVNGFINSLMQSVDG